MSSYPNTFSETTLPLSAGSLDATASQALAELADRGYEVRVGLTTRLADDIAAMAREPSIKEFCPNDSGSRFANREATASWLSKGRAAFLLLKRSDNGLQLAGYGWAGAGSSPRVPGGETTFAIRIGEAGQGQGLATPFARLILAGAASLYGAQDMWLETWASNGGAVHVYHKIGFQDVAEEPGERPSASGEMVKDTRLYMSLPNDLLPRT